MWGCVLEEFQECHDWSWLVLSSCSTSIYCKNIRLWLWSGGLIGEHKKPESVREICDQVGQPCDRDQW